MGETLNQQDLLYIFKSRIRGIILQLIRNNKKISISQIHRAIMKVQHKYGKKPYDYKAIYKQVIFLEKEGFLKTEKQKKKLQGQPVFVKKINTKKWGEMERILDIVFNR